jgi:hypothetical protein
MSNAPIKAQPVQYEFTPAQGDLIKSLGNKMKGVGAVLLLLAMLNFIMAVVVYMASQNDPKMKEIPQNVLYSLIAYYAIMGIVNLAVGVWTRSAGSAFRRVADTVGKDISHLMDGLGSLYKAYSLIYTIFLVALLLIFLSILGVAIFAAR